MIKYTLRVCGWSNIGPRAIFLQSFHKTRFGQMHTIWPEGSLKNYGVQLPSSGLLTLSAWFCTGFWIRRKCSLSGRACCVSEITQTYVGKIVYRMNLNQSEIQTSLLPAPPIFSHRRNALTFWKVLSFKKVMVRTLLGPSVTIFYLTVDIYMPATHLLQILIAEQQSKKDNARGKKRKGSETLWDPI